MFHETFRKWVYDTYGEDDILESEWERLGEEDTQHPYHFYPMSYPTTEIETQPAEEEVAYQEHSQTAS